MKLWSSWAITGLIVVGSIRGAIVLNIGIPAAAVYMTTAISLLILATIGFLTRAACRSADLRLLKNLLKINVILGIGEVAIDLFLGQLFEPSAFYTYLAPYIIFLLLRVPANHLNVAITLITAAISYSVFDNFTETLVGPDGVSRVMEYNLTLRPEVFGALSRTGSYYRASGYTGSYHDSACILGMAFTFFLIRFLLKRSVLDLCLSLIAMLSLTLTQSATNIVMAIATALSCIVYLLSRMGVRSAIRYMVPVAIGFASILLYFGEFTSIFADRVRPDGDWSGMLGYLDFDSLLSAFPFFLVGHAAGFGNEIYKSEIGFVKIIVQMGIVQAVILFWILLYPVFLFVKAKAVPLEALPAIAAVIFGFLSLIHYGSLFRVTNIFFFYSFCTLAYKAILLEKLDSTKFEINCASSRN